jgi:hypothetical protein
MPSGRTAQGVEENGPAASAGLLARHFGAFLSSLGKADGNRLFSAFHRRIALRTVLPAAFPYLATFPPFFLSVYPY